MLEQYLIMKDLKGQREGVPLFLESWKKYSIDIGALREVCFGDTGSIKEAGYIICWGGKISGRTSDSGVALAVNNAITIKMTEDPKPVVMIGWSLLGLQ